MRQRLRGPGLYHPEVYDFKVYNRLNYHKVILKILALFYVTILNFTRNLLYFETSRINI